MSHLSIYLVLLGLIALSSIHTNALRNLLEEKEPHEHDHHEKPPFHGGEKEPHDHEPSHPEDPRRHAMEAGHQGDHKPGHGGDEHMPGHGREWDRPGHGGEEHMPGHGGGRGPPRKENAPLLGSEKLVVIDGHGKHKPPHKGHPPLKGVVHLTDSQTTIPQSGKCPCGCNGDPEKHMPCACGCDGKSGKPCTCGGGGKPDKPIA